MSKYFNCPPPCGVCGQCHPFGTVCPNLRRGEVKKILGEEAATFPDILVESEQWIKFKEVVLKAVIILVLMCVGFIGGIVFDIMILENISR